MIKAKTFEEPTWGLDRERSFNKEEIWRNNQTKMNNKITEIKNTLEGLKSRLHDTEEWSGWKRGGGQRSGTAFERVMKNGLRDPEKT